MEYVGYADPTTRSSSAADLADREFIAFWHRDGIVTAAMNVNVWDVVEDLKAIITSKQQIPADRLADPAIPLADLV